MRARTIAAIVSLACIAGSTQARAKSIYGDDCSELDDTSPEIVTACAKSLLNRQSLINTSTSITSIIVDRFDLGPNRAEPAGLELNDPTDILQRLKSNGRITIAPAADVAAPAANPMWNIWIDGKYSWLDDTDAFTDLDGSLINGVVGADYKVTDRLVLGLMGTYETSDLDGSGVT